MSDSAEEKGPSLGLAHFSSSSFDNVHGAVYVRAPCQHATLLPGGDGLV